MPVALIAVNRLSYLSHTPSHISIRNIRARTYELYRRADFFVTGKCVRAKLQNQLNGHSDE